MNLEIIVQIFIVLISYLIGSILNSISDGKWIKGIDLRHYGSEQSAGRWS